MNLYKKIKMFAIVLLASTALLPIVFFGFRELALMFISQQNWQGAKDTDNAKIVIFTIIAVVAVISWITLVIQSCRINNNDAHFFIWLSIFGFIPICSLAVISRTSHLVYQDRKNKIDMIVEELEKVESQKEEENVQLDEYNNQEEMGTQNIFDDPPMISNQQESVFENVYVEESLEENISTKKSKKNKKKSKEETQTFQQQEEYSSSFDNNLDSYESDYQAIDEEALPSFNREKYLNLKGTNYSRERKEGKKKISSKKWEQLNMLVDQLERQEISERAFYKEKSKLLSK